MLDNFFVLHAACWGLSTLRKCGRDGVPRFKEARRGKGGQKTAKEVDTGEARFISLSIAHPTPRPLTFREGTGWWLDQPRFCAIWVSVFERGRRSPSGHEGSGDTLTLGVERILGFGFSGCFFLAFLFVLFLRIIFVARTSCQFPVQAFLLLTIGGQALDDELGVDASVVRLAKLNSTHSTS